MFGLTELSITICAMVLPIRVSALWSFKERWDYEISSKNEKSVPILGGLYGQIENLYHDKLTQYSDLLRKAINYAYHEWKAVVRYIENGNWSIDNNEGERRMKPVVLG